MKRLLLSALLAAVTLPSFAQSVSFSLVTAPCNNNGVLNAVVTGMTPPFTVQWYTQGTDGTVITHPVVTGSVDALLGYSGGPVTVVVSNSLATATNSYAGAPPFTYSISSTPAACPALGTASVTVTGGTAPYTYNWYNVATNAYIASTPSISATAGSYGITITDAAGCVYGSKVDPDASTIADISPFSITLSATTASCTNGSATVATVSSGATAPLSYAWSNGGRTATIGSLLTGSYSVSVTDALGCQATGSVAVPQSLTIAAGIITTAANCSNNDGTVTTFASGGTAPYTYLWSNGATTSSQTCLGAGTYRVTVSDANGCIANDVAFVGTSSPITVTSSASPSLCSAPSGNAALTISGGTGSYAVTWYTTPAQMTPTAINLAPGTYTFKVTDASGCEQSGSVVVPPVNTISASWAATSAMCTGATGALSVTPTGGTPPYSYLWSNGASTSSISGLATGNYNVKITDNLGCTLSRSLYVPANTTVGAGLSLIPSSCLFSNDGAISATPFGGTAPYSYGWSSGGVTPVIAALPAGPYFLNVTDAAGCVAHSYSLLDYDSTNHGCFCTITGIVYADTNNNCVQDPGEWAIPNVQIMCSGRGYTYTDASGRYSFQVPSGTYTITETVPAAYPLASCQSNNITVTSIAGPACLNTVDFANAAISVHDLHISTWNMSAAVPGNTYQQRILITNEGTVAEDSSLAAYKADGQLLVPTFTPACIFSAMGSHYYYADSLASLPIGATQTFNLNYNVPTNIPLGTTVTFKDTATFVAPISTWVSDFTPYNNVCTHTTTIRASSDANFKDVHPKGLGSAGTITSADSILEYMVHFQNMGAVFAQNVTVIDTLDNNLDWTSLHPVYMSHPAKVTLTQSGLMRIATYRFENINLAAASTDDARSQGIFTYTIKTRSGLPIGSTFKNRASIYFDYNEPVRTNQTLNTLGAGTTPINEVAQILPAENGFLLYPNPASRSFNIILGDATTATMNIADLTGKILLSKEISGSLTASTDVSQLVPGIYFVTLNQNGKSQTQKLVIMK